MYNTPTGQNPPKADYCCGRGNSKPKNGYYPSNKYYPSISAGPVRPQSQQQTPSLSYQRQTHDVSLLKKAGSTVVEYFEWDLPKVLSQGKLNFLSTLMTEGSLQSLMWSSPTKTLIAKGSSQNLVRSSTTRIVSHYMTSFLVLNHERVRYHNGL